MLTFSSQILTNFAVCIITSSALWKKIKIVLISINRNSTTITDHYTLQAELYM